MPELGCQVLLLKRYDDSVGQDSYPAGSFFATNNASGTIINQGGCRLDLEAHTPAPHVHVEYRPGYTGCLSARRTHQTASFQAR
jgi:hypothetical protein